MLSISFITANYVARALNYPGGKTADWEVHDQATRKIASAETFADVARDIAMEGFECIDIWSAHCHWKEHNREDYLEQVKGICSNFDFAITSYAGGLNGTTAAEFDAGFKFVKQLGAPLWAGGMWGADPAAMTPVIDDICSKYGLKWALENHPENNVEEILARIGGGRYANVGVALDTGWCATHGFDAVEAAKRLREKLLIVHLKDIVRAGEHETCALGEGIVPVEKVVRFLVQSGWNGNLSIEHEPFDRDPMPEIVQSLQRVKAWVRDGQPST